jgi:hypothetical protein
MKDEICRQFLMKVINIKFHENHQLFSSYGQTRHGEVNGDIYATVVCQTAGSKPICIGNTLESAISIEVSLCFLRLQANAEMVLKVKLLLRASHAALAI